jgi:hypothetical protein
MIKAALGSGLNRDKTAEFSGPLWSNEGKDDVKHFQTLARELD